MAHLGILEGNALLTPRMRSNPSGTLASSRQRAAIGPMLGAEISAASVSPQIIAKAKAAAEVAAAHAAILTKGPGKAYAATAAGNAAYNRIIETEVARLRAEEFNRTTGTVTTPLPFETSPSAQTQSQEAMRNYYNVSSEGAVTPPPAPKIIDTNITQDDLRNAAPGTSSSAAATPPAQAKSLVIPIAALAAAYFFLKG